MCGGQPGLLALGLGYGLGGGVSYGADGDYGHVGSVLELAARAYGHLLQRASPVCQHPAAPGVAYHERPLARQLRGVHQPAQLVLVHRRGYRQVRHGAQGSHVERTVVRGAVFAHEASPVEAEHHGQAEYCHVVYYVVIGALRERAVYVAEWLKPLFGHAARECHGVAFGYAHVEHAVGHCLHHDVHRAAGGHGGRHAHYPRVLACQLQQGVAEHVLVLGGLVLRVVAYPFACVHVKLARRVPYRGSLLGRAVALALYGVQVQQLRPPHVFQLAQYAHQLFHVMPVERPEIAYVEPLEYVLLVAEGRFERVAQAYEALAAVVLEVAARAQPL